LERKVEIGGGTGVVSLDEPVLRYRDNPILTADQVNTVWTEPHRRVVTVHNAGVAVVGPDTVMLFRSHLRSGVSVIGLARSRDGLTGWRVDPQPFLRPARPHDRIRPGLNPADIAEMESGGVEDPRINPIDANFAITYSAYAAQAHNRVRVDATWSAHASRSARAIKSANGDDFPEAVWDNEGGGAAPASALN
jgi:predicted GH43/DUF377 family glycosyl hydrolase